jgi:hypothetical protein
MPWLRIDDKSHSHRKVVDAGNAAWGLQCRLGAWSSDHGSDGFIPTSIAKLYGTDAEISALVATNLLHEVSGGYTIHDFLDWNLSASDVAKLRKVRKKAGSLGGKQKASKRLALASRLLGSLPEACYSTALAKPCPTPTPSPSRSSSESARTEALPFEVVPDWALDVAKNLEQTAGPFDVLGEWTTFCASGQPRQRMQWAKWAARGPARARVERERKRDFEAKSGERLAASMAAKADAGYSAPDLSYRPPKLNGDEIPLAKAGEAIAHALAVLDGKRSA